jgi:hypothetical protein
VSFVEIVQAALLLVLVVVPLGLLMTRSTRETQVTIDEFHGTLYLQEVLDQAASLPFEALPAREVPWDLPGPDPVELCAAFPQASLHVSPMRTNFRERRLRVRELPDPPGALKELLAEVVYVRPGGEARTLSMVTLKGRTAGPRGEGQ